MKTKSSWKTTLGGVLMALSPVLANTLPSNWHWLTEALAAAGAIVLGGFARDNNVTSEQAGAA